MTPSPRHTAPPLPSALLPLVVALATLVGCLETQEGAPKPPPSKPVQLTFLHTSDWHSRLLPYDLQLAATDRRLIQSYAPESPILSAGDPLVQIGGLARIATLVKRERARSENVVWVDSGDCFQGAPIFNAFNGEVEIRALSRLGADAVVIGNHEFDKGLDNLANQLESWATYPILAANYQWERDVKGAETMARITKPYVIVNVGGLKVGIIGMANLSSLNSIGEGTNSLGVQPLDEIETVQFYIDQLAGTVDLIGVTSHMGLTGNGERAEDYEVIDGTVGLDFVFGGHLHVVLDPPQVRQDKAGRPVVLTHSGAFMKYLGRLDVVVEDSGDPYFGYEITSHRYRLFPIDDSITPDPDTIRFLEPYILELNRQLDLTRIIAYAPRLVPRFGREKANSELGNIAAESMADRRGVQADFALTNTLGIRTDIIQGPITQDQMFNVFPFDNFVTKMFMSGREICEMMTFVARRSAGRGCQPQAQFSDRVHLKLNCVVDRPECSFASEVAVRDQAAYNACREAGGTATQCDVPTRTPMDPLRIYEVAVNDYIAGGGSGFRVLKFNNSKIPTDISIREAVSDRFQSFPTCSELCLANCQAQGDIECVERIESGPLVASGCEALTNCFGDVTRYRDRFCEGRPERDPRDFCDQFQPAFAGVTPTEAQAVWLNPLKAWCDQVDVLARLAAQGNAVEIEDDCFLADLIVSQAAASAAPVEEVALAADTVIRGLGIEPLSDRCQCRVDALVSADAECRELSCVIGQADDRLEAQLFETFEGARDAFESVSGDLCAEQAIAAGCDLEDLRGVRNDEVPN
ncbi:MAG: bifunctional metallophosphatase/5'-nucleotidase [Myxococcales bacterium]|nr:bifunctional metallophosphatase/5'-nucleotidase [Myxococcales bacterium]